jgi:GntR family transcriptional repressor for pyruvate dehydrogenase complex
VDPIDGSLPGGDGSADALDRSGDTRRVAHPLPEPAMPELATDAVLRPARTGNAFEDALERLLQAVKLGVFRQGDRLPPSRDLAARLAVSRVTLREALHALEKAGYLELRRGRSGGAFVTHHPSSGNGEPLRTRAAELDDVLVHREAVEVGAAAAAARVPLTAVQSGYLRRRADDVAEASLAEYRQADSRLHLAVAELTGSATLVAAVADARMRICDLLDRIPLLEPNLVHSTRQHADIVAAVLTGDPDAAARHMRDHLAGTAALLRGFLG